MTETAEPEVEYEDEVEEDAVPGDEGDGIYVDEAGAHWIKEDGEWHSLEYDEEDEAA